MKPAEQFKGTNLIEFMDRFSTKEKCKKQSYYKHTHYWAKKEPSMFGFVKL